MKRPSTSPQRGVFMIITAFGAILLVLMLGFVVDLSRLMVVQGELQNASDACALAAASELNGKSDATGRAAAVGSYVGGILNKKNFQAATVAITSDDVLFSNNLNKDYLLASESKSSINYRFAKCTVTHSGWINFFMSLVGMSNDPPVITSKAGLQQTRKACILPLALLSQPVASPYVVGSKYLYSDYLRIVNFNGIATTKTSDEYTKMIGDVGSCGIDTDISGKNTIGIDGDQIILSPTLLAEKLELRFSDSLSGSSGRRRIAIPLVPKTKITIKGVTSTTISGWVCIELFDASNFVFLGDINSKVSSVMTNACIVSGVSGYGASGPFTSVLVK